MVRFSGRCFARCGGNRHSSPSPPSRSASASRRISPPSASSTACCSRRRRTSRPPIACSGCTSSEPTWAADDSSGGRPRDKAYQELRDTTQSFAALAAYRATRASLGTGADARMVSVTFADHHYFPLLGVSAQPRPGVRTGRQHAAVGHSRPRSERRLLAVRVRRGRRGDRTDRPNRLADLHDHRDCATGVHRRHAGCRRCMGAAPRGSPRSATDMDDEPALQERQRAGAGCARHGSRDGGRTGGCRVQALEPRHVRRGRHRARRPRIARAWSDVDWRADEGGAHWPVARRGLAARAPRRDCQRNQPSDVARGAAAPRDGRARPHLAPAAADCSPS